MVKNKSLIIDFTLGNGTFLVILDKKTFIKKIKNLDKTEKLPLFFFDFLKKKKTKARQFFCNLCKCRAWSYNFDKKFYCFVKNNFFSIWLQVISF